MKNGGIYIHIPFCTEKCIYCDFYSLPNQEQSIKPFIKNLCKEILIRSKKSTIDWKIDTIFIGGGTPSLLSESDLENIISAINKNFNLNDLKEFTIEANPGEFDYNKMVNFKLMGVNRISFGFQSLNLDMLKFMSRWHTPEDSIRTFKNARKAGYSNINIDMIFGIPGQTLDVWSNNLETIVSLEPEHISAYSLTVEKQTPLYHLVQSDRVKMPHENIDLDMFNFTIDFLTEKKYSQYEISNYCKSKRECLHNLHYWKRNPYLSFGPSAHGFNKNIRYWNTRDLNSYMKNLNKNNLPDSESETLTQENIFNELILNSIRIKSGINLTQIKNDFNIETQQNILNKANEWGENLTIKSDCIKLSRKGMPIADEITLDLATSLITSN
ncbi:MAG: coproporphyrinogen III oxidase [Candidatus Marinimicrobia bacterium]|nr:coproporphyrinogen III oxidase [Candidatus Neomarinimicrobiota bacterium]|tara:strand:- start:3899 stop:5050 length:1152 start_codon:yes stop_codon:yes gene_type:complete